MKASAELEAAINKIQFKSESITILRHYCKKPEKAFELFNKKKALDIPNYKYEVWKKNDSRAEYKASLVQS
jgi:hypothetical protein